VTPSDDLDALIGELNATGMSSSHRDGPSQVEDWLAEVVRRRGSDLLLVAGSAPVVRLDGRLSPIASAVLDGDEVAGSMLPLLPPHAAKQFHATGIADASLRLPSLGRFASTCITSAAVRQAPDILVIGEMRDPESMRSA